MRTRFAYELPGTVPKLLGRMALANRVGTREPPPNCTVFIKSFLELAHPFADVEMVLRAEAPGDWLPGLAELSVEYEDGLLANVGIPLAGRRLERTGKVSVGSLTPLGGGVALPLSWQALSRRRLLPDVEAEFQASPIGRGLTQLSLSATYTPALGQVGEILDRTLMHRLAETVIRDFLNRVAARISQRLGEAGRQVGG